MNKSHRKPTSPVTKVAREELRVWLFIVIPIIVSFWLYGGK